MIPGLKNLSYDERLKVLQLPTLVYRRLRGDMIEAYKIATGKYETGIGAVLHFDNRTGPATRGHRYKLKERCNTRLRQNFFTERNSLPSTIVEASSVLTFEKRLDNYWKYQEVKFNYEAALSLAPHTTQQLHQQNQDLDI